MPAKATPAKKTQKQGSRPSHLNARLRVPKMPGVIEDWSDTYCDALAANFGQIGKAATAAGVTPRRVQQRRLEDAVFAKAEREAMGLAQSAVGDEIARRGCEGVVAETIVTISKDGAQTTRTKIEYDTQLILRLAERNETGSWRQKQQVDVTTPGSFATRAERLAALEKAEAEAAAADKPAYAIAKTESPT